MPRKIQRKPRRYLSERISKEQTTTKGMSLQDAVTILGGITGIVVAILWIAGRVYMAGYFGAMNIPAFQINFSIWEYAEAAWSRIVLYFLSKIFIPVILTTSATLISLLVILAMQRLFPKLKLVDLLEGITMQAKNLPGRFKYVLAFVLTLYFIYILLDISKDMSSAGEYQGRETVLSKSYAVEIYSRGYLPLGSPDVMPNTTPVLLHYSGLRLLTFNNGKYYLFRKIDTATCKPSQVFIISDNPDIHIAISTIAPMDIPCASQ
jgi:hypothetical protein